MAGGASASDRAGVSGSVSGFARLFPSRLLFIVISFMLAFLPAKGQNRQTFKLETKACDEK